MVWLAECIGPTLNLDPRLRQRLGLVNTNELQNGVQVGKRAVGPSIHRGELLRIMDVMGLGASLMPRVVGVRFIIELETIPGRDTNRIGTRPRGGRSTTNVRSQKFSVHSRHNRLPNSPPVGSLPTGVPVEHLEDQVGEVLLEHFKIWGIRILWLITPSGAPSSSEGKSGLCD